MKTDKTNVTAKLEENVIDSYNVKVLQVWSMQKKKSAIFKDARDPFTGVIWSKLFS
jgi:hypothetical protein